MGSREVSNAVQVWVRVELLWHRDERQALPSIAAVNLTHSQHELFDLKAECTKHAAKEVWRKVLAVRGESEGMRIFGPRHPFDQRLSTDRPRHRRYRGRAHERRSAFSIA